MRSTPYQDRLKAMAAKRAVTANGAPTCDTIQQSSRRHGKHSQTPYESKHEHPRPPGAANREKRRKHVDEDEGCIPPVTTMTAVNVLEA